MKSGVLWLGGFSRAVQIVDGKPISSKKLANNVVVGCCAWIIPESALLLVSILSIMTLRATGKGMDYNPPRSILVSLNQAISHDTLNITQSISCCSSRREELKSSYLYTIIDISKKFRITRCQESWRH